MADKGYNRETLFPQHADGARCTDCAHWWRTCSWLLGGDPDRPTERTCSWAPSQFHPTGATAPAEEDDNGPA